MTAAVRSSSTQMGLQVGGVEYATLDSTGLAIPAATTATQAVQLQQVSLYPTVASAATIDIFGAAGATINVSGTTTVTGITAATAAQVGSIKTIIPSNAAGFSITATANIVVDGATSGTYLMPQNANIQIIATSTTTFKITTIFATGTWTPNQGAGLTVVGAFSSSGTWTKVGNQVTLNGKLNGATSIAALGANVICTNAPFTCNVTNNGIGSLTNQALTTMSVAVIGSGSSTIYSGVAITATPYIYFTITFLV